MSFNRRQLMAAAGGVGLSLLTRRLPGQEDRQDNPELTAVDVVTAPTQAAINRGLAFLARRQNDSGSFGSSTDSRNVAVSALAGMAMMSSGSTPGRGPYGGNVNRCVDYILENTEDNGFIHAADAAHRGPMYSHGFATLFLAEVYGMTWRNDVGEKLTRAVELIVNTQNEDGGWRYLPEKNDADLSVTICQVMALRAARNAGIHVPSETIDHCIDYVKNSQNPDGGFMYMIEGGPSAFARSAAGVVALYSAGIYEGNEIKSGLDYLMQHRPRPNIPNQQPHYFYGHYYGVQAMWHAGGNYWKKWYPAIRDQLIARQRNDGSWLDGISTEYCTAMGCIILQMPNNYLPIFQR